MKKFLLFLIVLSLFCCPVLAVDDIFNTNGSITDETVYGGVRFALPDYYKLKSENMNNKSFIADDDITTLFICWCDTEALNEYNYSADLDGLTSFFDAFLKEYLGGAKPNKQSYSNNSLFGYDSISYYGEFYNLRKLYQTITMIPEINSIVITSLTVPMDDSAAKYETDYVNMLKTAYVENSTPQVENASPNTTENNSDFDWEKYGDAWSDLGNALENIESDDIGAAFDALGDAYQKLGELSNQ